MELYSTKIRLKVSNVQLGKDHGSGFLLIAAHGAATKNEDDPKIKDDQKHKNINSQRNSLSDEKTVKDASIVCQSFLDGVLIFF